MDSLDFTTNGGSSSIGSTLGIGTTAFIAGFSEVVTDNYSGTGFAEIGEETSAGTDSAMDAADGNPIPLTTVFGLLSTFSGSSSGYGDEIIAIVRTENKKAYSTVEKKAKEIYDKYDKNHIKGKKEVSLLTESPEVAATVNDILSNVKSKHELINQLELLEKNIIENKNDEKGMQFSLKKDR